MNKVILIGRLVRDPELRTTGSNVSVATFSLAVTRPYNGQSDPGADFINCVVWRRAAENLAKYCHKGSQVAVEGRIQSRNYTAQDGTKRYITEVLCENITFLGTKSEGSSNYTPSSNDTANDLPTVDVSEDPFKDFGDEVTLSDDDLPF